MAQFSVKIRHPVGSVLAEKQQSGIISASATSKGSSEASGIFIGSTTTPGNSYKTSLFDSAALENLGTINARAEVTGAGPNNMYFTRVTARGLEFEGSIDGNLNESASFLNAGTITAQTVLSSGIDETSGSIEATALYLKETIFGNVTNAGTMQAFVNGELSRFGYSIYAQDDGVDSPASQSIVRNASTGRLMGNLFLDGGVGLYNAGLVWLPEGANGIGGFGYAANVSGDFTQANTGTLKIGVYGGATDQHSQLLVGGKANLDGTISVDVRDAGSGPLKVGDTVEDVVVAADGVQGNFRKVRDNTFLFNFRSQVDGNTVDLLTLRGYTPTKSVAAMGLRPAKDAARLIEHLGTNPAGAGEMDDVLGVFFSLPSEEEMADAVYQTLPLLTGGASRLVRDTVTVTAAAVDDRLDGLSGGVSRAQEVNRNLWISPLGAWARQDEQDASSGYDSTLLGVVAGADGAVNTSFSMGGAIAYVNNSAEAVSDYVDQDAEIDSYQGLLYGLYELAGGSLIRMQLDAGRHVTDGSRHMRFGGDGGVNETAQADYDSYSLHVGSSLEHAFKLSEQTTFSPRARADYISVWSDGYTESGAGSLNLSVEDQQYQTLVLGLDGRLEHTLSNSVRLQATAGAGYDLLNERSEVTASYAGAPGMEFNVSGMQSDAWMLNGGVGLLFSPSERVEFSAEYNALLQDGLVINMAAVSAKWAF